LSIASAQQILSGAEAGTLTRNRRRLIVQVLSLVLLIAQLGMEAHAYSHLKPDQHGVPSTLQICGQCVSFAPLLGIVGGPQHVRFVHPPERDYILPADTASVASRLTCPAFRSRAPPHALPMQ
jgi:hypothetical protein